tara:strand:+ start:162 stop:647 length:486 start_codon:yes stop_codon:yes gene_type:complete
MLDNYKKIFQFTGRSSRVDYWLFYSLRLIFIIPIIFYFISHSNWDNGFDNAPIFSLFVLFCCFISLINLIVNISLSVRRLHDIEKSGWHYLYIFLLPEFGYLSYINQFEAAGAILILIAFIAWLYFFTQEKEIHINKYGKDPFDYDSLSDEQKRIFNNFTK